MEPFKDLLNKKMSRQEFLQQAGLAMMSVFGAGNMISYLLVQANKSATTTVAIREGHKASHGFGAGKFGV